MSKSKEYADELRLIRSLLIVTSLQKRQDLKARKEIKNFKNPISWPRSLIHKPKVLFLDEPTSGLDPVNARRIKDLVLELRNRGTTVFVTTHDMMVADELCDRVAFITAGNMQPDRCTVSTQETVWQA